MSAVLEERGAPARGASQGRHDGLPLFSTLRFRLILSVAVVHAVLMGAFIWDAVGEQNERIRAELESRGRSLSTLMAVATTNAVLAEDLAALAEVIGRVGRQPDVSYGEIIDVMGNVLASTDPTRVGRNVESRLLRSDRMPLAPGDRVLDIREDIRVAGRRLGTVFLGLSTRGVEQAVAAARNEGLLFILVALVVGSIAAWALSFAITRHLHALIGAVRRITGGDLRARVANPPSDEVGLLARAFNTMVESLERTSEEARAEHEKRTQAERLACVGELSASIAHEIRNPLAAIINSVRLLGGERMSSGDRADVLKIINAESERLQRILNDFLTFSRIPESRLREHDLEEVVNEVLALVENDPSKPQGIEVHRQFDIDDARACFDRDQIRQVLLNLILNAFQAMPEGGRLTIAIRREGPKIELRVADTGCGIPPELLERVTHPFVTGRKDGTGLGLSVVQRILMQHGTQLRVESHVGVGTEASFTLGAAG